MKKILLLAALMLCAAGACGAPEPATAELVAPYTIGSSFYLHSAPTGTPFFGSFESPRTTATRNGVFQASAGAGALLQVSRLAPSNTPGDWVFVQRTPDAGETQPLTCGVFLQRTTLPTQGFQLPWSSGVNWAANSVQTAAGLSVGTQDIYIGQPTWNALGSWCSLNGGPPSSFPLQPPSSDPSHSSTAFYSLFEASGSNNFAELSSFDFQQQGGVVVTLRTEAAQRFLQPL